MALYKDYNIIIDTKRSPRISLQNIVAGETGNRVTVTLTNDDSPVSLESATHRVCLRVDSDLGTRRQDSSVANSGITFSNGKAVVLLSRDSFTAGMNRCRLEVFTTESEANDTLICSAEWIFRAYGNPSGENAGEVYPSLIELENEMSQLIDDAQDATEAANDAAEAANDAAEAANAAAAVCPFVLHVTSVSWDGNDLSSIEFSESASDIYNAVSDGRAIEFSVDTTHAENGIVSYERRYVRQMNHHIVGTSPYSLEVFLYDQDLYGNYCSIILSVTGGEDEIAYEGEFGRKVIDDTPTQNSGNPVASGGVYTALAGKQNTLTFDNTPTSGSNNPVKSGGIKTAIDAAASQIYIVPHGTVTWSNDAAQFSITPTKSELLAAIDGKIIALIINDPSNVPVVLYQYNKAGNQFSLQSLRSYNGKLIYATLLATGSNSSHPVVQVNRYSEPVVTQASVSDDVVTFKDRLGNTAFDVTLDMPLTLHVTGTTEFTSGGHTLRSVTFANGDTDKIYAYRNTRDMYVELPVWNLSDPTAQKTVCLRKHDVMTDSQNTTVVSFECFISSPSSSGAAAVDETQSATGYSSYVISVFFINGTFYGAYASYISFDLPLYNGGVQ